MKSYQILAPAGSVEQLKMAVNNGADAVYLGLDRFNARMKAENFTANNIAFWVDYCHFFGVKVYVAINTSLKNIEFQQAVETLKVVYQAKADGAILTDLALIKIASVLPKPFEVVASTQLNTHDDYGARFLQKLGVSTVVCARECTYEDIQQIAQTGVTVESFIHGALCVSQSGQCLFSSIVGGNSGNRGLCAQPCRKKYTANGKNGYFLSPRDMYGLDVAKKVYESGARVFKIEGRNRRAEYAGVASRVYSKAFEKGFVYSQKDKDDLAEMYNRGGLAYLSYLQGDNDNVIYPQIQNHIGLPVGVVKGKGVVATVPIAKGDGLKILHNDVEICGGVATASGSGFVTAEFSGKVSDGMIVRRTTSVNLCEATAKAKRTIEIALKFVAYPDSAATLTACCGNIAVEVQGDFIVPKSQNQPADRAQIFQQLQKIGDSHYTITDIDVQIGDIFLAKSQINGLRRQVFALLDKEIVAQYDGQFANRAQFDFDTLQQILSFDGIKDSTKYTLSKQTNGNALAVVCVTKGQLEKANGDYLLYKPECISKQGLQFLSKFCYLDLPSFANLQYLKQVIEGVDIGLVCHNVGQVQFARENNLRYIAGSGLNLYNDYVISQFNDADTFVYSLELSLAEISALQNKNGLIFVDGDITLMKLVHCPYKVVYRCSCANCKCDNKLQYVDELGNAFYIRRRRDAKCSFELVNGKKLSAVGKINKGGRYLVDYDEAVILHYTNLNNGVTSGYVENAPYTKGKLFNKIN